MPIVDFNFIANRRNSRNTPPLPFKSHTILFFIFNTSELTYYNNDNADKKLENYLYKHSPS